MAKASALPSPSNKDLSGEKRRRSPSNGAPLLLELDGTGKTFPTAEDEEEKVQISPVGSSTPSPLFDSASDPVFLESKTNLNPSSTDRKDAAASRKSRLNQEEPDRDEEAPMLPSGDMHDRRRSRPATSADMMEAQPYRKARKYLSWVLLAIIILVSAIVGAVTYSIAGFVQQQLQPTDS